MQRIQRLIFATALLGVGCTSGGAEPVGSKTSELTTVSGLQVSISAPQKEYGGGLPIEINSSIKNVTGKEISLGLIPDLKSYRVEVTTEKGEPVPLTRYGERLYGIETPPSGMGPFALGSGEEAKRSLPLTRICDMTTPGTYLVKVKRFIRLENEMSSESKEATSNVLRITVL